MSTLKVDTVRPVTTDGSLTLQGDSSGSGITGITIDSSGNTTTTLSSSSNIKAPLNATGSAPVYACRAWVNFRGTTQSGTATASGLVSGQYTATVTSATQFTVEYSGTTYTINTSGNHEIGDGEGVDLTVSGTTVTIDTQIRASGNVSSITDNGTGDYTVNFTTAMPDADYIVAMQGSGPINGTTWHLIPGLVTNSGGSTPTLKTSSAVRYTMYNVYNVNPGTYDASDCGVAIFR